MTDRRCDVCSAPDPRWAYPVRDFGVSVGTAGRVEMKGDWIMCDHCHGLMELGNVAALTEFSVKTFIYLHDLPDTEEVRDHLTRLFGRAHIDMVMHLTGEPKRLEET